MQIKIVQEENILCILLSQFKEDQFLRIKNGDQSQLVLFKQ